jgi:Acyl-protein synthetase, LuxE
MIESLEVEILRFFSAPSEDKFEPLALKIFECQRRENLPYGRYCELLETPQQIVSWKRIPAVPQQAFKRSELRSFPVEKTGAEFHTSGTTGEGRGKHLFLSLRLYEAAVQRGWDFFGLPRQRFMLLMQHPDDAPFSSLCRMGGFLADFRRECFLVMKNGCLDLNRLKEGLSDRERPLTLFGTALAFLNLFEQAPNLQLKMSPGSIAMETGGFKGSGRYVRKNELYELFSQHLGISTDSIWNEYGMTELSSQFYSNGISCPHRPPPWMKFLIIDPNTNEEVFPGEVGLLRIVDLANLWSVLAVQTQDMALALANGGFLLLGRDPTALPRGCSRAMDELMQLARN